MNFPSRLIEDAVNEFSRLPGIGKKTALRLVLHLLRQNPDDVDVFGNSIIKMRRETRYCSLCFNISDHEVCGICSNPTRDKSMVCVVESLKDVIAIEGTGQFYGVYHILGGVISPVEGIGPDDLRISNLEERVAEGVVSEVIMAISPTIEGDTTIFYISKRLQRFPVKITSIARGIAFGGELEYTDENTLARSIATRRPYENYLVNG